MAKSHPHVTMPGGIGFLGAPSLTVFQGRGSFLDFLSARVESNDFNDPSTDTKTPTLAENRKDGAPANSPQH
jgi:hypothetical protein